MVFVLGVENMLEGISNFWSWKSRTLMLLNEQYLKDHVPRDISEPEGAREKSRHKKNEAIAMRILMDSEKDHLVPIIASQDSAMKMYDVVKTLFENENPSRILALKD